MNCRSVQQFLSAYVDRELPGVQMLEIRSHLFGCPVCMREEVELKVLKALLSNSTLVEPPPEFEERLMARIDLERSRVVKRGNVGWFALSAAVAAAAITFALLPARQIEQRPMVIKARTHRDIAFEIQRDQAFFAGNDPLGGGQVILAADNLRH